MGFLTKEVPWANWQFGPLKFSMLALGIILGSLFADFWRPLLWHIGLLFLLSAAWVTIIWIRAMKRSSTSTTGPGSQTA